ncbi:histidinol dehydrogenase [Legionella oakridgensis]|uniref:histidinol dehydrogenase n=1 Tax=Legionella oakridgensis TaxID=29423 RepID=UPI0003DE422A|nr:histidinol dehydrogenase [Legionella oakridgensis]ETO93648.1 histidinol dehydrogenase [Legionella oakridgensis RV-2-2007]
MLTIEHWQDLSLESKRQRLTRPQQRKSPKNSVCAILTAVKEEGDQALLRFTREFDGVSLSSLAVAKERFTEANISSHALTAIKTAIQTITAFHQAAMPKPVQVNTAKGVHIKRLYRPLNKVGLYVPGGNHTPLISSLLMQAIPALIAGCPVRILCTPPNSMGELDPNLLVAARLCQIETIYTIGGAQAIAAMAFGTKTIPKVDKIFGPGNRYVTEAKTQVSIDPAGTAIDMPAGPSEVMIIADDNANPAYVAADLLAQAEHGTDSQVLLICESLSFAEAVNIALKQQLQTLSRQAIILQSLAQSRIFTCRERTETWAIINQYAPEHLIINRTDAPDWVSGIENAGTIFLGPWAAETLGDYATGSNHVLPTNGFARSHSGLSTTDFLKAISVQSITEEGLEQIGETAYTLAMLEGLDAHAQAVKRRLTPLGELL